MKLAKILCFFVVALIGEAAIALPVAKMTIKVTDEVGNPIIGAEAGVMFFEPANNGPGTVTKTVSDVTNVDGTVVIEGKGQQAVDYYSKMEGYYTSAYWSKKFTGVSGVVGFRRWEPWNPTLDVILKKIKDPVPLYALQLKIQEIPVVGEFIGFDLERRDWVVPHGKGLVKDFLFKLERKRVASRKDYDATLTLKFSNPADGIQSFYANPNEGSQFKSSYHAPSNNYDDKFILEKKRLPDKRYSSSQLNPRLDQNFYFRVRTEVDDEGNIISARYGKIYGPIRLGGFLKMDTGFFGMTYYLNPNDNDTNIEFDMKKNLFKGLSDDEKVRGP